MKIIGFTYLGFYEESIFKEYIKDFTKETKIDVEVSEKGITLHYQDITHYVICDDKEMIITFLEGIKVCGMNFIK